MPLRKKPTLYPIRNPQAITDDYLYIGLYMLLFVAMTVTLYGVVGGGGRGDGDGGCRTCAGSGRMMCNSCGGSGTSRPLPPLWTPYSNGRPNNLIPKCVTVGVGVRGWSWSEGGWSGV
ncbi:hypothetical protein HanIR_Chr13g0644771 [Helianthus annuus]|nr:hypothetical protein HanIR_Chr13g0644771 [Helianthus annuus]